VLPPPPEQEPPFSRRAASPGKFPGLPLKPKLTDAPGASGPAQLGGVKVCVWPLLVCVASHALLTV
jgi:hypothetical protein